MAWTDVDSSTLAPVTGLSATQITTGQLALARGGTNADLSATGGTSQVLQQASAGATITVGQLAASNLSNGVTGSGAVVLATSPTLVTPALGAATGTSLVLSSTITERGRSVAMGEWATFTPAMAALTGTWTGGTTAAARYMLVGKTLFVNFISRGGTLSSGTGNISITIPGSFTAAVEAQWSIPILDNATRKTGSALVNAAGTSIVFYPMAEAYGAVAWTAGTVNVNAVLSFEIQ